jgi:hypothetical protein
MVNVPGTGNVTGIQIVRSGDEVVTIIAKTSGFRAFAAVVALGAFVSAGSASATTLIDFTDRNQWDGQGAGATYSFDYGWFTAAISTNPPQSLNFSQNFDGPESSSYCQASSGPLACQSDGLGVINDEISEGQSVTVTFSRALRVTGLHFFDLFRSASNPEINFERAVVHLNGDPNHEYTFDAVEVLGAAGPNPEDENTLGGHLFASVNWGGVTSMTFFPREGFNDDSGVPDFALAGLQVVPIPLPAAGWGLLTALGGLVLASRRRNKAHA